jgi:hypothetical protein
MLHAGLDLSRRRLDVHLMVQAGEQVEVAAVPPDADGLRGLAWQVGELGQPVRAAIESMNGARFVHDQLELAGWEVQIADAQKVKGLAPLACKTDRIDAWVLAELSRRDLVPEIWLPTPGVRAERERARFRLHLVRHRTALKNRVHATCWPSASPARPPTCSAPMPEAAWAAGAAGAMGGHVGGCRGAHRRLGRADRRLRAGPAPVGCRPPLHPVAGDRPGDRLGAGLHHRRRGGRHRPVPLAQAAVWLRRAVPTGLPVRRSQPSRPAGQERPQIPAVGADRSGHPRRPSPCYHHHYQATRRRLGKQRGAKVAGSRSPASSPRPSGTCSPARNHSCRQGPTQGLWSPDDPRLRWPAGRSHPTCSSTQEAIER